MFSLATDTTKLFFSGKLFRDNAKAMTRLAMGAGAGLVAGVLVGLVAPFWLAAIIAGAVAGGAQPFLFKDVKYA